MMIVLGAELTEPPGGKTPGMLIWYRTSSSSYVLRDDLEIIIAGRC
jgi:hypothetical protein